MAVKHTNSKIELLKCWKYKFNKDKYTIGKKIVNLYNSTILLRLFYQSDFLNAVLLQKFKSEQVEKTGK